MQLAYAAGKNVVAKNLVIWQPIEIVGLFVLEFLLAVQFSHAQLISLFA